VAPVLSETARSRLVLAGSLTADQVNEVPFTVPKVTRAAELGEAPGWIVRKYGPVPPLQVIRRGSHSVATAGVLTVNVVWEDTRATKRAAEVIKRRGDFITTGIRARKDK